MTATFRLVTRKRVFNFEVEEHTLYCVAHFLWKALERDRNADYLADTGPDASYEGQSWHTAMAVWEDMQKALSE